MLLRDEVYDHIKRRIVSGELAPGARLQLGEISDELEVSRTPVREALRRLDDEGYVETLASRWTRVKELDTRDAERMYPIRWALEAVAIRTTKEFTADHLDAMRTANARLRDALVASDWTATSDADEEFHMALVAPCQNPELTEILHGIRERLLRFGLFYWAKTPVVATSADEHDEVIRWLEIGDREHAAEAITSHWMNSLQRTQHRTAVIAAKPAA